MAANITLIANSGIQIVPLRIDLNNISEASRKDKLWFHEWYDDDEQEWKLELVSEIADENSRAYFPKRELQKAGFLASNLTEPVTVRMVRDEGIVPLVIDGEMCQGVQGQIYSLKPGDKDMHLDELTGKWLPLPYFFKRTTRRWGMGPWNWTRIKLIPVADKPGVYDAILAVDTHADMEGNHMEQYPVFDEKFRDEMLFGLCSDNDLLLDYCSTGKTWSFVNEWAMQCVHPGITNVDNLRGSNVKRLAYIASYLVLIDSMIKTGQLPDITLRRNKDVETIDVDMVVDVGNSRTSALLVEDNTTLNQVKMLGLMDMTQLVEKIGDLLVPKIYHTPIDMRLTMRRPDFGKFGPHNSRQFVYPSLVRLGAEAQALTRAADTGNRSHSTCSSAKRYLWDWQPQAEEWELLTLPREEDDHVINVPGVTEYLQENGKFEPEGCGALAARYSRRSLMTLSILEMLVQAHAQINSIAHRDARTGYGHEEMPRRLRRLLLTCPTAMSTLEREALTACARDAVKIFNQGKDNLPTVIPAAALSEDPKLWYDEATSSQLVYMYGEAGYKYQGAAQEFINLHGKNGKVTIGSLDIGAGTSDLLICQWQVENDGNLTQVLPTPVFSDSYYYAGDDMLRAMIKDLMLLSEDSAFFHALPDADPRQYRQLIKNLFGKDYNGQTQYQRQMRRDIVLQYCIPLMYYFLKLASEGSEARQVTWSDFLADTPPNMELIRDFSNEIGVDLVNLTWNYDPVKVKQVIKTAMDPLLSKVATLMHSFDCDIILLSGRPASLEAIRELFLKYYAVSPDRLISLNNHYVGDWNPFTENTGYMHEPKTIVSTGALLAYYSSAMNNLDPFRVDVEMIKEKMKPQPMCVYQGQSNEIKVLDKDQTSTTITVLRLPQTLSVKELDIAAYPSRPLYNIDFNTAKIQQSIRNRAWEKNESLTPQQIAEMTKEEKQKIRSRLPLKLAIERDGEDPQQLIVSDCTDMQGESLPANFITININSLGLEADYWLDNGIIL